MNEGRAVSARLTGELPQYESDKCVRRYGGNHQRAARFFATEARNVVAAIAAEFAPRLAALPR